MGKKAQLKRNKRNESEKQRKETLRLVYNSKNPIVNFWKRIDFWIYIFCFIALVAFPFVQKDAFASPNKVMVQTSMGDVEISFYDKSAPKTIENFTKLIGRGFYDDMIFHRVIKGFMIQTGDPLGDGTGGESADGGTFADEINADSLGLDTQIVSQTPSVYGQLSAEDKPKFADMTVKQYYESKGFQYSTDVTSQNLVAGSVAMANYGPNTNGSQFFIVTESAQPHLDGQHTVFGHVSSGMDVVKKISEVAVDTETDKPLDPVKIISIQLITE